MIHAIATMLLGIGQQAGPPPIQAAPPSVTPVPPPMRPAPPVVRPVDPNSGVRELTAPPGLLEELLAPGTPARPLAPLTSLITPGDYPKAAVRRDEEGTVGFRLDVTADGRVSGCTITGSSGSALLDATTCRIMRSRPRFAPARDPQGKPRVGRFSSKLTWRVNRPLDRPFAPMTIVDEMRADATGAVSCWSATNGAPAASKPCPADGTASGLGALALRQGKPLVLSSVISLTPDGASEPSEGSGRGDLYRASDARLTIAPDGAISACSILRREWLGGGNVGLPPSPCADFYVGMRLYVPAPDGAPPRTVMLRDRGYAAH